MKKIHMIANMLMVTHFGNCDMDRVETCSDCLDFKTGVCPGEDRKGKACFECMLKQAKNSKIHFGSNF